MNPPPPAGVQLDAVRFGYGASPVVRGVSLAVPPGQLLALLGPSGCGKTTLLKLLGGYLTPSAGRVFLRSRDVTTCPPEARNAGMVFQQYALFPHLTVRQNVSFGLDVRRVPSVERTRRVQAMLHRVGLSETEWDRKPAALSGGQQQRVALARALVIEPDVLLLDEPFSNLDRHLRDQLRAELRALQQQSDVTTVFVTHDQEEALCIADTIGVMAAGYLLQMGTPTAVYERPRTPFVARFLGAANLLRGRDLGFDTPLVMLRPEHGILGSADGWNWTGRVTSVSFFGADQQLEVTCDNGVILRVRIRSTEGVQLGQAVSVGIPKRHVWPIPDTDPPELAATVAGTIGPQPPSPPV